jgi:tRNA nucleotidyltransferase (CCA-adding enzyme)
LVNIGKEIKAYLPREMLSLIKAAGRLAAEREQKLYLVGGMVRDIFLNRPNLDLDLVLEGDAPSLARELAKARGGNIVIHARFGTATYRKGKISLDIVTARSETYSRPGALPTVKPGTIGDDLFRRDFTMNAMAASLEPAHFGELVDPYRGKDDLDRRLVRILHKDSFRDDPTRIWRAIRYEQRLDFRLEQETERLLRRDVDMMGRVSGDRLRHELERILEEERPEKALRRADELGALQQLSPSLKGNGWLARRFKEAREISAREKIGRDVYLALLAWRLNSADIENFIQRLRFGNEVSKVLRDIPEVKQTLSALTIQRIKPSVLCRLLEHHHQQAVVAASLAADSTLVRRRLRHYLAELRFMSPSLSGEDLKSMGVPQGKKLGALLRSLKAAKLDGMVKTREQERELVRKWLDEGKV